MSLIASNLALKQTVEESDWEFFFNTHLCFPKTEVSNIFKEKASTNFYLTRLSTISSPKATINKSNMEMNEKIKLLLMTTKTSDVSL